MAKWFGLSYWPLPRAQSRKHPRRSPCAMLFEDLGTRQLTLPSTPGVFSAGDILQLNFAVVSCDLHLIFLVCLLSSCPSVFFFFLRSFITALHSHSHSHSFPPQSWCPTGRLLVAFLFAFSRIFFINNDFPGSADWFRARYYFCAAVLCLIRIPSKDSLVCSFACSTHTYKRNRYRLRLRRRLTGKLPSQRPVGV